MRNRLGPIVLGLLILGVPTAAADAAGLDWKGILKRPDGWHSSPEGKARLENLLANQAPAGDWPKNVDTSARVISADRSKLKGTFDNGATVGEIRVLARAHRVLGDARFRSAALKGLDHVLKAQYVNGGWPQSSPPGSGYGRYITYNDNTFVNLLELVRDAGSSPDFAFLDEARREKCRLAFDRGVDCLLKSQIRREGRRLVWCAQHDATTLEPRPARTFELASLSGSESARILRFLMTLPNPSPEIVAAIEDGAAWFRKVKIEGIRQVKRDGDKFVEPDPTAPPLWARFYQIGTNRPFVCGRDGVMKFALAEIEKERRIGYSWYGEWGVEVERDLAAWRKRIGGPALGKGSGNGQTGR